MSRRPVPDYSAEVKDILAGLAAGDVVTLGFEEVIAKKSELNLSEEERNALLLGKMTGADAESKAQASLYDRAKAKVVAKAKEDAKNPKILTNLPFLKAFLKECSEKRIKCYLVSDKQFSYYIDEILTKAGILKDGSENNFAGVYGANNGAKTRSVEKIVAKENKARVAVTPLQVLHIDATLEKDFKDKKRTRFETKGLESISNATIIQNAPKVNKFLESSNVASIAVPDAPVPAEVDDKSEEEKKAKPSRKGFRDLFSRKPRVPKEDVEEEEEEVKEEEERGEPEEPKEEEEMEEPKEGEEKEGSEDLAPVDDLTDVDEKYHAIIRSNNEFAQKYKKIAAEKTERENEKRDLLTAVIGHTPTDFNFFAEAAFDENLAHERFGQVFGARTAIGYYLSLAKDVAELDLEISSIEQKLYEQKKNKKRVEDRGPQPEIPEVPASAGVVGSPKVEARGPMEFWEQGGRFGKWGWDSQGELSLGDSTGISREPAAWDVLIAQTEKELKKAREKLENKRALLALVPEDLKDKDQIEEFLKKLTGQIQRQVEKIAGIPSGNTEEIIKQTEILQRSVRLAKGLCATHFHLYPQETQIIAKKSTDTEEGVLEELAQGQKVIRKSPEKIKVEFFGVSKDIREVLQELDATLQFLPTKKSKDEVELASKVQVEAKDAAKKQDARQKSFMDFVGGLMNDYANESKIKSKDFPELARRIDRLKYLSEDIKKQIATAILTNKVANGDKKNHDLLNAVIEIEGVARTGLVSFLNKYNPEGLHIRVLAGIEVNSKENPDLVARILQQIQGDIGQYTKYDVKKPEIRKLKLQREEMIRNNLALLVGMLENLQTDERFAGIYNWAKANSAILSQSKQKDAKQIGDSAKKYFSELDKKLKIDLLPNPKAKAKKTLEAVEYSNLVSLAVSEVSQVIAAYRNPSIKKSESVKKPEEVKKSEAEIAKKTIADINDKFKQLLVKAKKDIEAQPSSGKKGAAKIKEKKELEFSKKLAVLDAIRQSITSSSEAKDLLVHVTPFIKDGDNILATENIFRHLALECDSIIKLRDKRNPTKEEESERDKKGDIALKILEAFGGGKGGAAQGLSKISTLIKELIPYVAAEFKTPLDATKKEALQKIVTIIEGLYYLHKSRGGEESEIYIYDEFKKIRDGKIAAQKVSRVSEILSEYKTKFGIALTVDAALPFTHESLEDLADRLKPAVATTAAVPAPVYDREVPTLPKAEKSFMDKVRDVFSNEKDLFQITKGDNSQAFYDYLLLGQRDATKEERDHRIKHLFDYNQDPITLLFLYGRDARTGSFRNDPQDAIISFLKENPQYNSILIKENQPTLVEQVFARAAYNYDRAFSPSKFNPTAPDHDDKVKQIAQDLRMAVHLLKTFKAEHKEVFGDQYDKLLEFAQDKLVVIATKHKADLRQELKALERILLSKKGQRIDLARLFTKDEKHFDLQFEPLLPEHVATLKEKEEVVVEVPIVETAAEKKSRDAKAQLAKILDDKNIIDILGEMERACARMDKAVDGSYTSEQKVKKIESYLGGRNKVGKTDSNFRSWQEIAEVASALSEALNIKLKGHAAADSWPGIFSELVRHFNSIEEEFKALKATLNEDAYNHKDAQEIRDEAINNFLAGIRKYNMAFAYTMQGVIEKGIETVARESEEDKRLQQLAKMQAQNAAAHIKRQIANRDSDLEKEIEKNLKLVANEQEIVAVKGGKAGAQYRVEDLLRQNISEYLFVDISDRPKSARMEDDENKLDEANKKVAEKRKLENLEKLLKIKVGQPANYSIVDFLVRIGRDSDEVAAAKPDSKNKIIDAVFSFVKQKLLDPAMSVQDSLKYLPLITGGESDITVIDQVLATVLEKMSAKINSTNAKKTADDLRMLQYLLQEFAAPSKDFFSEKYKGLGDFVGRVLTDLETAIAANQIANIQTVYEDFQAPISAFADNGFETLDLTIAPPVVAPPPSVPASSVPSAAPIAEDPIIKALIEAYDVMAHSSLQVEQDEKTAAFVKIIYDELNKRGVDFNRKSAEIEAKINAVSDGSVPKEDRELLWLLAKTRFDTKDEFADKINSTKNPIVISLNKIVQNQADLLSGHALTRETAAGNIKFYLNYLNAIFKAHADRSKEARTAHSIYDEAGHPYAAIKTWVQSFVGKNIIAQSAEVAKAATMLEDIKKYAYKTIVKSLATAFDSFEVAVVNKNIAGVTSNFYSALFQLKNQATSSEDKKNYEKIITLKTKGLDQDQAARVIRDEAFKILVDEAKKRLQKEGFAEGEVGEIGQEARALLEFGNIASARKKAEIVSKEEKIEDNKNTHIVRQAKHEAMSDWQAFKDAAGKYTLGSELRALLADPSHLKFVAKAIQEITSPLIEEVSYQIRLYQNIKAKGLFTKSYSDKDFVAKQDAFNAIKENLLKLKEFLEPLQDIEGAKEIYVWANDKYDKAEEATNQVVTVGSKNQEKKNLFLNLDQFLRDDFGLEKASATIRDLENNIGVATAAAEEIEEEEEAELAEEEEEKEEAAVPPPPPAKASGSKPGGALMEEFDVYETDIDAAADAESAAARAPSGPAVLDLGDAVSTTTDTTAPLPPAATTFTAATIKSTTTPAVFLDQIKAAALLIEGVDVAIAGNSNNADAAKAQIRMSLVNLIRQVEKSGQLAAASQAVSTEEVVIDDNKNKLQAFDNATTIVEIRAQAMQIIQTQLVDKVAKMNSSFSGVDVQQKERAFNDAAMLAQLANIKHSLDKTPKQHFIQTAQPEDAAWLRTALLEDQYKVPSLAGAEEVKNILLVAIQSLGDEVGKYNEVVPKQTSTVFSLRKTSQYEEADLQKKSAALDEIKNKLQFLRDSLAIINPTDDLKAIHQWAEAILKNPVFAKPQKFTNNAKAFDGANSVIGAGSFALVENHFSLSAALTAAESFLPKKAVAAPKAAAAATVSVTAPATSAAVKSVTIDEIKESFARIIPYFSKSKEGATANKKLFSGSQTFWEAIEKYVSQSAQKVEAVAEINNALKEIFNEQGDKRYGLLHAIAFIGILPKENSPLHYAIKSPNEVLQLIEDNAAQLLQDRVGANAALFSEHRLPAFLYSINNAEDLIKQYAKVAQDDKRALREDLVADLTSLVYLTNVYKKDARFAGDNLDKISAWAGENLTAIETNPDKPEFTSSDEAQTALANIMGAAAPPQPAPQVADLLQAALNVAQATPVMHVEYTKNLDAVLTQVREQFTAGLSAAKIAALMKLRGDPKAFKGGNERQPISLLQIIAIRGLKANDDLAAMLRGLANQPIGLDALEEDLAATTNPVNLAMIEITGILNSIKSVGADDKQVALKIEQLKDNLRAINAITTLYIQKRHNEGLTDYHEHHPYIFLQEFSQKVLANIEAKASNQKQLLLDLDLEESKEDFKKFSTYILGYKLALTPAKDGGVVPPYPSTAPILKALGRKPAAKVEEVAEETAEQKIVRIVQNAIRLTRSFGKVKITPGETSAAQKAKALKNLNDMAASFAEIVATTDKYLADDFQGDKRLQGIREWAQESWDLANYEIKEGTFDPTSSEGPTPRKITGPAKPARAEAIAPALQGFDEAKLKEIEEILKDIEKNGFDEEIEFWDDVAPGAESDLASPAVLAAAVPAADENAAATDAASTPAKVKAAGTTVVPKSPRPMAKNGDNSQIPQAGAAVAPPEKIVFPAPPKKQDASSTSTAAVAPAAVVQTSVSLKGPSGKSATTDTKAAAKQAATQAILAKLRVEKEAKDRLLAEGEKALDDLATNLQLETDFAGKSKIALTAAGKYLSNHPETDRETSKMQQILAIKVEDAGSVYDIFDLMRIEGLDYARGDHHLADLLTKERALKVADKVGGAKDYDGNLIIFGVKKIEELQKKCARLYAPDLSGENQAEVVADFKKAKGYFILLAKAFDEIENEDLRKWAQKNADAIGEAEIATLKASFPPAKVMFTQEVGRGEKALAIDIKKVKTEVEYRLKILNQSQEANQTALAKFKQSFGIDFSKTIEAFADYIDSSSRTEKTANFEKAWKHRSKADVSSGQKESLASLIAKNPYHEKCQKVIESIEKYPDKVSEQEMKDFINALVANILEKLPMFLELDQTKLKFIFTEELLEFYLAKFNPGQEHPYRKLQKWMSERRTDLDSSHASKIQEFISEIFAFEHPKKNEALGQETYRQHLITIYKATDQEVAFVGILSKFSDVGDAIAILEKEEDGLEALSKKLVKAFVTNKNHGAVIRKVFDHIKTLPNGNQLMNQSGGNHLDKVLEFIEDKQLAYGKISTGRRETEIAQNKTKKIELAAEVKRGLEFAQYLLQTFPDIYPNQGKYQNLEMFIRERLLSQFPAQIDEKTTIESLDESMKLSFNEHEFTKVFANIGNNRPSGLLNLPPIPTHVPRSTKDPVPDPNAKRTVLITLHRVASQNRNTANDASFLGALSDYLDVTNQDDVNNFNLEPDLLIAALRNIDAQKKDYATKNDMPEKIEIADSIRKSLILITKLSEVDAYKTKYGQYFDEVLEMASKCLQAPAFQLLKDGKNKEVTDANLNNALELKYDISTGKKTEHKNFDTVLTRVEQYLAAPTRQRSKAVPQKKRKPGVQLNMDDSSGDEEEFFDVESSPASEDEKDKLDASDDLIAQTNQLSAAAANLAAATSPFAAGRTSASITSPLSPEEQSPAMSSSPSSASPGSAPSPSALAAAEEVEHLVPKPLTIKADPAPQDKQELAEALVAELQRLGISKWISDFDGTLLNTHTASTGTKAFSFLTGYKTQGGAARQAFTKEVAGFFADLELLKEILKACNKKGIEFEILSRQSKEAMDQILYVAGIKVGDSAAKDLSGNTLEQNNDWPTISRTRGTESIAQQIPGTQKWDKGKKQEILNPEIVTAGEKGKRIFYTDDDEEEMEGLKEIFTFGENNELIKYKKDTKHLEGKPQTTLHDVESVGFGLNPRRVFALYRKAQVAQYNMDNGGYDVSSEYQRLCAEDNEQLKRLEITQAPSTSPVPLATTKVESQEQQGDMVRGMGGGGRAAPIARKGSGRKSPNSQKEGQSEPAAQQPESSDV